MDRDRAVRFALVASLVLLVQAAVPPAIAHSGSHDRGAGDEEDHGTGFPLTADRSFAEQLNPDMDGPRVVWQERSPGEGETWDIMLANVSDDNVSVIPLTNTDHEEKWPVIQGDRIAWTVFPSDDPGNRNLAVLDLSSGRVHHVPDTGGDEKHPTFGGDGTLYYVVEDGQRRVLHAFDLDSDAVHQPLGNRSIVGEPAAYGHELAWAEGSRTSAKFHIKDTRTGEVTEVEGLYNVQDGPVMGPAGLAWIARYGGEFARGSYTTVYNETTGVDKLRSHVYPHGNVENCEAGVIWDQPGTSTTDASAVALWDRHVEGTVTLGADAFGGTCGADHLVYEQNVQGDAESGEGTRQLYIVDLETMRLFREATITIDSEDRRSIVRSFETLEGTASSPDPREPIARMFGSVDGSPPEALNTTRTEEGMRWEAPIDPGILEPGRHLLEITAVDEAGRSSSSQFTFYTERRFDPDAMGSAGEPNVPREGGSPFPLNIFNHYQDYQPFYNTVLLGLLIIAALAWYGYRRLREEPVGRPEYVPPEDP